MAENNVKVYRIEGKIMLRTGEWQKFVIDVSAIKVDHAIERIYSTLSGLHKVKRSHIHIKNISIIPPEETKNPLIRSILELKSHE